MLLLAASAWAIEPGSCRESAFPGYAGLAMGKVVARPGEQVSFQGDWQGCPGGPHCISEKIHLLNGDSVLAAHPGDGWVCVWYFGKKMQHVGWMPQANIASADPAPAPQAQDWIGTWSVYGDPTIRIAANADADADADADKGLSASGTVGAHAENPHPGRFSGTGLPSSVYLSIEDIERGCVVGLQLIGTYLVATDDGHCAETDLRFNGVYRKVAGE